MKKKRFMALALALCVGVSNGFSVLADEDYLNETFEASVSGEPPSGWTTSGTDSLNTVAVSETDSGKAVLLKAVNGGFPAVSASFSTGKGELIAEAKVQVQLVGGDTAFCLVDSHGTSALIAKLDSDYQLYATDGSLSRQVASYRTDVWYRIVVVVDTSTGAYSLLLNGEEVASHFMLPDLGAQGNKFDYSSGISGIAFNAFQGTDPGITTVLWDDARAYSGKTPRRDEQFETLTYNVNTSGNSSNKDDSSVSQWGFQTGDKILMLPNITAVKADERLLGFDRFIDDFTGRSPRRNANMEFGWNSYTKGNPATVEFIEKDGNAQNKAIRIESVNADEANMMKVFSGDNLINSDVTVEAKFYVETLGATQGITLTQSPNACRIVTLQSNGDIVWQDGTKIASYNAGEWVQVTAAVNFAKRTADCYINGQKVVTQQKFTFNGTGFDAIRFFSNNGVSYLDDVYIYFGTDYINTSEWPDGTFARYVNRLNDDAAVLERLGKGTIAMKVNSSIAYVDGNRTTIDGANSDVTPILNQDSTVVPVRFILENLGYTVSYDEATRIALATNGEMEIKISLTDGTMVSSSDGKEKKYNTVVENGRTLIPIRVLANWIGKRIYWNDDGVCILGDNAKLFDSTKDATLIERLYRMLTFTRPTGKEILADMKAKFPRLGHNRLYLTDERMNKLMGQYNSGDAEVVAWVDKYLNDAAKNLGTEPLDYDIPDGTRLLTVSRTMEGRMMMYAVAYRLSGDTDTRFAEQAWKEMERVSEYPNWNETHFLDVAEMARGFAIAYDTFYDWMTPQQRALCVKTLKEKALYPALYEYRFGNGATNNGWANGDGNWNPVCNAGMMISAVAIAEDDEALAAEVLESALLGLEANLVQFAPDGAWREGPGYWHYTIEFISNALDSLFTSTGKIYNYLNVSGIGDTAKYYLYIMGPGGAFNYGDMMPQYIKSPELYWYADMMKDGTLAALYSNLEKEYNFGRGNLSTKLYYDQDLIDNATKTTYPYDAYFRKWWIGSLRSSWQISDATFVAFQGGRPNAGHSQMEIGNFVLDALGERWALDLGYDDYNIGYLDVSENARSWWIYRKSTEGNNCFLINPDDQVPQVYNSDSPISAFQTADSGGYGVINLSPAYARQANWAYRGFKIDRATDIVTIQDEFEVNKPDSEYYWFMHTKADISISEDGKTAILSQNGKRLYVTFSATGTGSFSVMDTVPLPTSKDSGVRDKEAKNEGVKKLVIHLTGLSGKNTVSVSLAGLKDSNLQKPIYPIPAVTPIDKWTISDEQLVLAQADSISLDGQQIEDFSADKYNYNVKLPFGTTVIPSITASGAKVEIAQADSLPGTATIKVSEENHSDSYYLVSFKVQPLLNKEPDDMNRLKIKSVTASAVPQAQNTPENTLDGNFETKWAGSGESWIQYELTKVEDVSAFMTSWMNGNQRLQYFDVKTSVDGENWTPVYSGESTGETILQECYPIQQIKAKYIRVSVHGTSEGSWSSLQEFAAYGK